MLNLNQILIDNAHAVEGVLKSFLKEVDSVEGRLIDAMRYSVLGGGKRVRPFLVTSTADLFNVDKVASLRAAAAVEMVHCYSLVHDDLPAMDNDDIRRGKPTCHIQFDYATAILAGDALLTKAFEILSDPKTHNDAKIRSALCFELAKAAGERGMVGGQMFDLMAADYALNLSDTKRLQQMKTGALISASCAIGGILGEWAPKSQESLQLYSKNIGLAFQITDDLLDVEGLQEKVGKKIGKDNISGKVTYVSLLGVKKARKKVKILCDEAIESLELFGKKGDYLKKFACFIVNREF